MIAAGRPAMRPPLRGPIPWLALLGSVNVWGLCLMYGFVGFVGELHHEPVADLLEGRSAALAGSATTWLAGLPLAAGIVSCHFRRRALGLDQSPLAEPQMGPPVQWD